LIVTTTAVVVADADASVADDDATVHKRGDPWS